MDKPAAPAVLDDYFFCHLRFFEREVLMNNEEASRYLQQWTGRIEWTDPESGEGPLMIGAFSLCFADLGGALVDEVSRFDVFDTSQATFEIFETLFDLGTYELSDPVKELAFGPHEDPFTEGVLMIDRLTVLPAYRGHAMGLAAMKCIIEQFRAASGIVVIKVFPLQFEAAPLHDGPRDIPRSDLALDSFARSERVARTRLKKYYGRLGFVPVPRTEYMVLDPNRKLPSYEELTSPPAELKTTKPAAKLALVRKGVSNG